MKLIDRYVFAVMDRLPEDLREDVSRELRTNIEDMLPEDPTETDIRKVLERLGNPWTLANEYTQKERYLIGPGLYDKYIATLKMVLGIFTTVLASITLFVWAVDPPIDGNLSKSLIELFIDLLLTVIQGGFQVVLWVTLVFAILEKSGVSEGQIPFFNKKWSPDDLPALPTKHKRQISRGETVFSMFCTVLFLSLFFGNTKVVPLFVVERLQSYITIILLVVSIQLGIFIWKLIINKWNIYLAITNAAYNAILCVLFTVMLNDRSLLSSNIFPENGSLSIWIFLAVFISICIWDSIAAFIKCRE